MRLGLYHGKIYIIGAPCSIKDGRNLRRAVELMNVYTREFMFDALWSEVREVSVNDYPEVFL
jgi:hypothetical protein